jgi:hypothetical protein
MNWDRFKKGFDKWEAATAEVLERGLRSPKVLRPAGTMLTGSMRLKAAVDASLEAWWSAWRLPTRTDQERTLHTLHELQTQLFDLEEKLEDLRLEQNKQR